MANSSTQDAKQAAKNGMPLSPKGKQHPKPYGKGHGRKSSRKS